MSARLVLFVSPRGGQPERWEPAWGEVRAAAPGTVLQAMNGERADVALVDGAARDPVGAVRELHTTDATLLPIVLTPSPDRHRLQRALLFAPGVGETWLTVREELNEELLERATAITHKRRSFRAVRRRISDTVVHGGARDARPWVTDAYLAALLQVLPDPTAAVDEQGRVLFWSDTAERMLGTPAGVAIGQPFDELIHTDAGTWNEALRASAGGPTRRQVQYRDRRGEVREAVLGIAPITIGSQRAHAAILHDVTEERRAQERLRQQAAALEEQARALVERTEELARVAAEKDALLRERERTLRELRRAIDVRSRFYASMNHEIRTPINAMLGYTDLLLAGTYGELAEPQQRALQQSRRAAQHLIEIVNDLLDISRLEAGRLELLPGPLHIADLFHDLLATMRPLAADHGSELQLQVSGVCPSGIISDSRRVRQIALNLLSNAIKFGQGKPIEIRCLPMTDGGIAIEVEDHGVGISEADLPRIFEEFVQVGGKTTSGTGLGLPISRRLAAMLGGRLTVRSKFGEGSTFRLELPQNLPLCA